MRAGDFQAAWRINDAVLASRDPATRDDPRTPYHLRWVWDGTPPDGRDVLVRCYHGLGDTLQFARFLPALRARAAHLTVEAQPELCALLGCIAGIDRLVPFDPARPSAQSGCDIEIMELAHVLRADAATCPYLSIPADRLANGRRRAAGHVALCWTAGNWDNARSIPLQTLLAALAMPGRRFISLQRGIAAAEADARNFVNPGDRDTDAVETAALICGADHVVTVDTMVAHLAGALGRRATLLLKPQPDWRWPENGSDCIWYPSLHALRFSDQDFPQQLRESVASN